MTHGMVGKGQAGDGSCLCSRRLSDQGLRTEEFSSRVGGHWYMINMDTKTLGRHSEFWVRDCIMSMNEDLSRGPTVLHLALMNRSGENI
jgi:hypothetical protein